MAVKESFFFHSRSTLNGIFFQLLLSRQVSLHCREAIQIIQQLLIIDNSTPDDTIIAVKEKVLALKNIKVCPACDKTFKSPSYLRHHLRVHTG